MTGKATVGASVAAKPFLVVAHSDAAQRQALLAAFAPDFTVHSAAGGREAIALLGRLDRIDALVVDHKLASPDARTLLRYVQEMVRGPETIAKLLLSDNGASGRTTAQHVNGWVDEVYEGVFDAERIRRRVRSLLVRKTREKRSIMRTRLGRTPVEADIGLVGRVAVDNISEDGMFVRAVLPRDYIHPITIRMADGSTLLATGRVVRVDEAAGGTGIQFLLMEEDSRRVLLRLIADSQIEKDLADLRAKYPFLRGDNIVAFTDPPRIEFLLAEAFGRPETELTVIGGRPAGAGHPAPGRPRARAHAPPDRRVFGRPLQDLRRPLRLLPIRLRHLHLRDRRLPHRRGRAGPGLPATPGSSSTPRNGPPAGPPRTKPWSSRSLCRRRFSGSSVVPWPTSARAAPAS